MNREHLTDIALTILITAVMGVALTIAPVAIAVLLINGV